MREMLEKLQGYDFLWFVFKLAVFISESSDFPFHSIYSWFYVSKFTSTADCLAC